MSEQILVFPEEVFLDIGYFNGISKDVSKYLDNPKLIDSLHYTERKPAETNPKLKQLIPYSIIAWNSLKWESNPSDKDKAYDVYYFVYQRTNKSGETRLHNLYSLGVGGHINPCDGEPKNCYEAAFMRELKEEIDLSEGFTQQKIGLIYDDSNEVGKVHFGVVHKIDIYPNVTFKFNDPSLDKGEFWSTDKVKANVELFENWSKLIVENLL